MGMAPRWSGAEQQGGSARLHGLLLAHGPELLGRLGLDVDLVQRQPQRRGDALAHGRNVRRQLGGLGNDGAVDVANLDRKSTRLNSSHSQISYAVFCLKKKKLQ